MIFELHLALAKLGILLTALAVATSTTPIQVNMENAIGSPVSEVRSDNILISSPEALQVANFANNEAFNGDVGQTSTTIKQYVAYMAGRYDVPIERALWIAEKESQFEADRIGDTDKKCPNGEPMQSVGVWQINLCYHDVSIEFAQDIVSSTLWAMPRLKETPEIWSTFSFCRKWYKSCPF